MGNSQSQAASKVPMGVLQAEIAGLNQGDQCEMEIVLASYGDTVSTELENSLYKRCKKYSLADHEKFFIPIKKFSLDHLPINVRDEGLLSLIKWVSSFTVKLSVAFTSRDRPKHILGGSRPGSKSVRWGTGRVIFPTAGDPKHFTSYDPAKTFIIVTAAHVVFDDEEAARTTVRFFYDDDNDMSQVIRAKGVKVLNVNVKDDACELLCEVASASEKQEVIKRMNVDYKVKKVNLITDFAFAVSHPHGTTKKVSLGCVISVSDYTRADVDDYFQLVSSKCVLRGIHEKKMLYFWMEKFHLVYYLRQAEDASKARYIGEVLSHLEDKGCIQRLSTAEEEMMWKEFEVQREEVREVAKEQFLRKYESSTFSAKETETKMFELIGKVKSEKSSTVDLPDRFISQYWEVIQEMTAKVKDVLQQTDMNTSITMSMVKSMTYSIPTCPGTSGASVAGFIVRGGRVQMYCCPHHGARDTFVNYSSGGMASVL